jgi:electron transport complex protein RnfD
MEEDTNKSKAKRQFIAESSPHIFSGGYKYKIMWIVVLALLPANIAGIYFFGQMALLITVVSVCTAVLTDAFFEWIRKKSFGVEGGSAVITGLLLAMIIPPTVPLWVPALGSFIAISLAKHAFGGAGHTIFNPALIGRAFLVAAFPALMTAYIWPDGVTSASPLTMLKLNGYESTITAMGGSLVNGHYYNSFIANLPVYTKLFIGNHAGSLGETSALLLLTGGLFLILLRIIDWKIPAIYIGTVFVLAAVFGQDPIFHILSGGLFIGAFFMATAYEGCPITRMGRVYFALGCGLITMMIRLFGGYPEGVNYSILIMNAAAPLIERLTIERPFGAMKKRKNELKVK